MNFFTSFVTAFCAACVFIGAIYMLCPDGEINKSVKYVLGLVFILSIISASAFFSDDADFELITQTAAEIDTTALDTTAAEYAYAMALTNSKIEFEDIEVCTDKTEDDRICISKVIIYSDCEDSRIKAALSVTAENTEVEIIND